MTGGGKEFLFVDESGNPGPDESDPFYILIGVHIEEEPLAQTRKHLAAFRYHHDIFKEYKDQGWSNKLSSPTLNLLDFLAHMTDEGDIAATANWLRKSTYKRRKGPYLSAPKQTFLFRNFQLRLLLERHRTRKPWGERFDLVVDRWRLSWDQRRDLEDYLRDNYGLRPVVSSITMVDSLYADPIQAVDVYARLARRVVDGSATPEERTLNGRLMDLREVTGGLFSSGGPYGAV